MGSNIFTHACYSPIFDGMYRNVGNDLSIVKLEHNGECFTKFRLLTGRCDLPK